MEMKAKKRKPTIVTSENREAFMAKKLKLAKEEKPVMKAEAKEKQKLSEHGLPIDKNGNVRLYHGTDKESAQKILSEKIMRSKGEPDIYFTTHPKHAGYGEAHVGIDVPHHLLELDDEFPNGRKDFRIKAPKKMLSIQNPALESSPHEKDDKK
jgi:hypothetical protein